MKYIDEYRDGAACRKMAEAIAKATTRPWTIMEICGGQTHSIVKFGIEEVLPPTINLVHGPGCPVCVTPIEIINKAIEIAARPDVIFCSFGDMLRVPGSESDLWQVKATGGDVRIVYSPMDAVTIAKENPDRQVVFFAVGFETTAPANAMAAYRAHELGLKNFSLLVSHVLVPPAVEAILSSEGNQVQAFLAAGHVCAVMGGSEYESLSAKYQVPIVITGFEPLDILHGIFMCIKQLEEGRAELENQYSRVVLSEGNRKAQEIMLKVFEITNRNWRGLGTINSSGLALRGDYQEYDAERRFGKTSENLLEVNDCHSARVLLGKIKPPECPSFGTKCTPEHPLGATMVSSEGACAAYYRYRKIQPVAQNYNQTGTR